MKPICTRCFVEMYVDKIGIVVVEMAKSGPYRLWHGDLFRCRGCCTQIAANFGEKPMYEIEATFEDTISRAKAADNIIYCYESVQQAREFVRH